MAGARWAASCSSRMTSIDMLSLVFTNPVPRQCGQSGKMLRFETGRMRCRVISMMPNCEMRRILVRARSRRTASRSASSTLRRCFSLAHVDEVVDDDAAEVAQPQLPGDLLGRVQVHLEGGLLGVVVGAEVAAVDVDGDQRLGLLDDDASRRAAAATCFCWMLAISSSMPYLWNSGSVLVVVA